MILSRDPEDMAIEDLSKGVAQIYAGVSHKTRPMLRWALILNDATILAEEVRRNRTTQAGERSGKIFMRLLDFMGYYLYLHKPGADDSPFADRLADVLKLQSHDDYFESRPAEGLTRWVLAKYPYVCAKCGGKPCECVLRPWVFENRREDPGPYHEYRIRVERARRDLKSRQHRRFTVPSLIRFFNGIYRNGYYNQDSWKLVMHFTEELGEATTELTRLELLDLGKKTNFDLPVRAPRVKAVAAEKIKAETKRISAQRDKRAFREMANQRLDLMTKALVSETAWDEVFRWTGDKLKEELSDVFSWLCAVIHRFGESAPEEGLARAMIGRYIKETPEGEELKCPWCGKDSCSDDCLVRHGIASELIEHVLKF